MRCGVHLEVHRRCGALKSAPECAKGEDELGCPEVQLGARCTEGHRKCKEEQSAPGCAEIHPSDAEHEIHRKTCITR